MRVPHILDRGSDKVAMAKDLYWKTHSYLTGIAPKFGKGPHRGYCFRIKAPTFAVDSSTVRLTTDSFDWARRRLVETLRLYGTAGPVKSPAARPKRLVFQIADRPRLRACRNGTADVLKGQ